ncbi:Uncharacterized protein XB15_01878 [Leptospira santarosai]|nr:Uncharacterized protein XB15_01878 [Leptospira santarosai]
MIKYKKKRIFSEIFSYFTPFEMSLKVISKIFQNDRNWHLLLGRIKTVPKINDRFSKIVGSSYKLPLIRNLWLFQESTRSNFLNKFIVLFLYVRVVTSHSLLSYFFASERLGSRCLLSCPPHLKIALLQISIEPIKNFGMSSASFSPSLNSRIILHPEIWISRFPFDRLFQP